MTAQAATQTAAAPAVDPLPRASAPGGVDDAPARAGDSAPPPAVEVSRAFRQAVQHWLDWQCRMIAGVHHGAVFVPGESRDGPMRAAAVWPDDANASQVAQDFAEQALAIGRSVMHKAVDDKDLSGDVRDFIAFPVVVNQRTLGVIALALEIRAEAQRQAVLQLLAWGAVWLENTLLGVRLDRRDDAPLALNAVATLAADLPLAVTAHQFCNLLAEAFGCSQVAIGTVHGMQVRIVALSEQLQFDRRQDAIVRLQTAMEECIDQEEQVCLPRQVGVGRGLVRAHERLLETTASEAVCSLPVVADDDVLGAVTLSWEYDDALDSVTTSRIGEIVTQLGPVMALKRREQEPLWRRIGGAIGGGLRRLFGAGWLKLKLTVVTVVALIVALGTIHTDRRVAADAVIEGMVQRAIVAPVDGYLLAATVRAGDLVEQGQVLATIDDRELQLEAQKWRSERDKHAKEYQEALGSRERAKISIAAARMAQAEAELRLVNDQMQRTKLRAPFSGTLVSGDLSRSLGAPLQRGQVLFEIVPDDTYRVSLQVDEHDIAGLQPGQSGDLRLAGMPETPIGLTIQRIIPLATAGQAGNRFRVEASLDDRPAVLRPGMQGVAKVVIGRTSLANAWADDLVDRLRYRLWSLGY
ncbi:MAG: HlyD family efflux transporter periplasmic adaptor subunit [Gammaproteobacteria bacterium]|nr:HlyD family efflux transporter periplasmic adaptor subunit [Gammaproteobacteria bacterium]